MRASSAGLPWKRHTRKMRQGGCVVLVLALCACGSRQDEASGGGPSGRSSASGTGSDSSAGSGSSSGNDAGASDDGSDLPSGNSGTQGSSGASSGTGSASGSSTEVGSSGSSTSSSDSGADSGSSNGSSSGSTSGADSGPDTGPNLEGGAQDAGQQTCGLYGQHCTQNSDCCAPHQCDGLVSGPGHRVTGYCNLGY